MAKKPAASPGRSSPPSPKPQTKRDQYGFEIGEDAEQEPDLSHFEALARRSEDTQERQVQAVPKPKTPEPEEPAPAPKPTQTQAEAPKINLNTQPAPKPETPTMNKMDAVRSALQANPELTAKTGVPYLKEQYGVDISPAGFASYKQIVKKEQEEGGGSPAPKPAPVRTTSSTPAPKAAQAQPTTGADSVFAAIKHVKELLKLMSPEQAKQLVDELAE